MPYGVDHVDHERIRVAMSAAGQLGDCACGMPATTQYMNYRACSSCSPAARAGRTVPTPDPRRTMEGLRRTWYAERALEYVPLG